MEKSRKCDEANLNTFDFKLQKPHDLTESEPKRFNSAVKLEDGVSTWTPEKSSERLAEKSSKVEDAFELPQRHKVIVEMFRQMSCSLRLLALCKKATTFCNVRPQVEILVKRKFSYKHLGQIKYILPEAVEMQKIIIHDEETQCMKPDLKINLVFDVVKDHKQKSNFVALCHLFNSRVVDFVCTHSEGCDIPEAKLPQPFNQENESALLEPVLPDDSIGLISNAVDIEPLKYYTLTKSTIGHITVENMPAKTVNSSSTPMKSAFSPAGSTHVCDSPLVSHIPKDANLMVETPIQLTPKRTLSETEERQVTVSIKALTMSEKPAKRALDFNFETADRYALENTVAQTEQFLMSHQDTLQAARSNEYMNEKKDKDAGSSCTVSVPDQNEESTNMSCNISSSLHGCALVIHQIFRSVNYSSITKQELVFKILINSLDMDNRGVVEQHLQQLELCLPNWITKRTSPSGDHLYSIKRLPDLSALLSELQS